MIAGNGSISGHARVAMDAVCLRASDQDGRGHAVVWLPVSSWLNGRSPAINADDIDADQVVVVALMDGADGRRPSDRAVFPLTRRPRY